MCYLCLNGRDWPCRQGSTEMSYVIRYHTASHTAADGDFETLEEAREAFAEQQEWYEHRLGAIVEGTTDFMDDVRRAEIIA